MTIWDEAHWLANHELELMANMSPDELKEFLARGQSAQRAVDAITDTFDRPVTGPDFVPLAELPQVQQNTPEWHEMRRGKVTASRIGEMMAKPRVPGEGLRANYLWQLVCERLTGKVISTYASKTMTEAHEWEPIARAAYTLRTDNKVRQVAFIEHPDIPMCGCSPDGLIGDDGIVSIKCPERTAHGRLLVHPNQVAFIDSYYVKQSQWEMACTGRRWTDYVSFNDDFPEDKKLVIVTIKRDAALIDEITAAVRQFQLEIDLTMSALK